MGRRRKLPHARIFSAAQWSGAGFSLLELLTVLVLLAIVAGITAPQMGRLLSGLDFRKQVGAITASLRSIRLEAISTGREMRVTTQDNIFIVQQGDEAPEEKNLALDPESSLTMKPGAIFFTPQATATPAILTFTAGTRSRSISVDALTGLPIIE